MTGIDSGQEAKIRPSSNESRSAVIFAKPPIHWGGRVISLEVDRLGCDTHTHTHIERKTQTHTLHMPVCSCTTSIVYRLVFTIFIRF
jgi:hypothetical protein